MPCRPNQNEQPCPPGYEARPIQDGSRCFQNCTPVERPRSTGSTGVYVRPVLRAPDGNVIQDPAQEEAEAQARVAAAKAKMDQAAQNLRDLIQGTRATITGAGGQRVPGTLPQELTRFIIIGVALLLLGLAIMRIRG